MVSISNSGSARNANRIILLALLSLALVLSAAAQVTEYCDITAGEIETPHEEYKATQLPAEVGKPVQWVKQVDVQNLYDQAETELLVNVPADARNIAVTDMATGATPDVEIGTGTITIRDTIGFNEQRSYLVKYETPPPEQTETGLARDGDTLVKNVIVSSEYHYEDVLTYTEIPEVDPQEAEAKIRIYWQIDGVRTDVTEDPDLDLRFYDINGNGLYDRISWVTPHLSTQIFEIVIFSDADPGSYPHIGITLLNPADGQYITSNRRIGFNYSVSYNSSTIVYCNLTVDGIVRRENIPTASDTEITTYFNLSSGVHSWNVNCAGDDGSANTSATRTFTLDLDSPAVTLNTPDYHVSHASSIDLNFTATDDKYPVLVCSMSVNGALNRTGIVVTSGTLQAITLTGLPNGVYDWNVSCQDAAGNLGSSEERVFYISAGTPSEYNVTSNKGTYSIAEVGYMIITAKAGSNLTLFIDAPQHDSFFYHYNGASFPLVETINFTNNAGTYNIDGIFYNNGQIYIVHTSFDVTNTFYVEIDANQTTGVPDTTFSFEANATGGIGGVTYEWDFGDGTTGNGSKVEHAYSSVGEYTVELTATDTKNNKVTDRQEINIYNKHNVQITVKELQTKIVLANIPVEVDDERKYTDGNGQTNFTVYEGKRRIYVAYPGYEWVKQVRNITEDISITIELNNTAITNYTPLITTEQDQKTAEAEQDAKSEAEELLAKASSAIENLESQDKAAKAVIEALRVEEGLQQARKTLRQIIRDLGNAEESGNLTSDDKSARISNITARLEEIKRTIAGISVEETTEFVDYPRSSDVSMLSAEYLKYRQAEYSDRQKEAYIEMNTKLQEDITITTRLSRVKLSWISGTEQTVSVVINRITKMPVSTTDTVLIEYVPKEAAQSTSDIEELTDFEVVKSDPILKFSPDSGEYSYYIKADVPIDDLKKTKHLLLHEPTDSGEGLSGVTGLAFLPRIHIKNPKLAIQIIIILALLVAYVFYHFEIIDKIRERRKRDAPYETDMAYKPESTIQTITRKVKSFVNEEEALLLKELSHIKTLLMLTHNHADNEKHEDAAVMYKQVMGAYKGLSREAKERIHPETQQAYSKVLISKINSLVNEAHVHLQNDQHGAAKSRYSEIKKIYTQLEKEHRAAVSERCMKLHAKLFEQSLA